MKRSDSVMMRVVGRTAEALMRGRSAGCVECSCGFAPIVVDRGGARVRMRSERYCVRTTYDTQREAVERAALILSQRVGNDTTLFMNALVCAFSGLGALLCAVMIGPLSATALISMGWGVNAMFSELVYVGSRDHVMARVLAQPLIRRA